MEAIERVDYLISTKLSKFDGYQSKKGNKGYVKAYISNLWNYAVKLGLNDNDVMEWFLILINSIFIHERFCLERAFQKIRIKGGMCSPCCVENIVRNTLEYLFDLRDYSEV